MENQNHAHAASEKLTSGSHDTAWINTVEPLAYSKLMENLDPDVVVIGGGIAGVTTAYCLSRSGKKVVILEDGFIGSGETGRTTAHLVTALDDRYYELEHTFGEKKASLIAESHREAIDFIEHTSRTEQIPCDFKRVDGYLFLHPSDKEESITKELEAATKAGLQVEEVNFMPGMPEHEGRCLRFLNQAQFHPLKYLKGLCEAIRKNGGAIYTNTHAKEIDHTGVLTDEGFRINAKHIVVATNTPVNNLVVMHLKQYAYRTYVIAAKIKKGSLPECLWWDTGDFTANENIPPYHYVRTQNLDDDHDLLIIGGEDHATGLADIDSRPEEERYAALENWAKQNFKSGEILYRWSGQVMEPMDGLAYMGRNPMDQNNVYIITGDSGNGMTHATIGALLIDDLINNRENKFEDLYDPSRFKAISAGSVFFKEFVGGFRNYMKAKKKDAKDNELDTLRVNEGKIIELSGKKYGVFCDENNELHFVGTECTHLKCTVRWNNDEKSWDCPCHGSRFSYEGKVLNGPANTGLPYHRETRTTNTSEKADGTVFGTVTNDTKNQKP